MYLIMLSVKQEGIKYHFWNLWCDLTWDSTPVYQAIGEHSNHKANECIDILMLILVWLYIFPISKYTNMRIYLFLVF